MTVQVPRYAATYQDYDDWAWLGEADNAAELLRRVVCEIRITPAHPRPPANQALSTSGYATVTIIAAAPDTGYKPGESIPTMSLKTIKPASLPDMVPERIDVTFSWLADTPDPDDYGEMTYLGDDPPDIWDRQTREYLPLPATWVGIDGRTVRRVGYKWELA